MDTIFTLRKTLQNINVKHWQYLFLGTIISISSAIFWFYYSIIIGINLNIIIILSALIQGFIAYLFMEVKGEARKIFFSLLFSFLSFFIGKYLFYEHYYDWILNAYIDKTVINKDLVIFYLKEINIKSIGLFMTNISKVFSLIDILWVALIVLFSLIYMFLPFEEHKISTPQNMRKMFRKRRFE